MLEVLYYTAALFVPADQPDEVEVLPSWVEPSSWREGLQSFSGALNRDLRSEWTDSRMGPQKSCNSARWIKHIDVSVASKHLVVGKEVRNGCAVVNEPVQCCVHQEHVCGGWEEVELPKGHHPCKERSK